MLSLRFLAAAESECGQTEAQKCEGGGFGDSSKGIKRRKCQGLYVGTNAERPYSRVRVSRV
jgi:hypothetical protein